MKSVFHALAAAYEIAWKCGVVVIAVALLKVLAPDGENFTSAEPSRPVKPMVISRPGGDTTRVTFDVSDGSVHANCLLLDQDGNELLLVTYDRSGCLLVKWGNAFPIQPGCTATRDGSYHLDARHNGFHYRLRLRPDRTSEVTVSGIQDKVHNGLGVTVAGELVRDPSVLD